VNAILATFDVVILVLQRVFLGAAIVAGAACAVEWGVRTRRLTPFSRLARTSRRLMAPVIKPVEAQVVRAGGVPSSAPWWALAAIVVTGIVALSLLDFVREQIGSVYVAVNAGPRGIIRLFVRWTFALLYIGIFVRVIASWIRVSPYRWYVRWAFVITEPILAPLRRILPPMGMLDLSPLVAYLALSWILQPLIMRLI
jgi:YggT family protein